MDSVQARQGTSMPPSPSPSPGVTSTLGTVDIVVLVVYFLTILAVGLWVSTGACPLIRHWSVDHWSEVTVIWETRNQNGASFFCFETFQANATEVYVNDSLLVIQLLWPTPSYLPAPHLTLISISTIVLSFIHQLYLTADSKDKK